MTTMDSIRQQLLLGLEKEFGIDIPLQTGAALLKINDSRLWIDFDSNKDYICVHFLIDDHLDGNRLTVHQLQTLARLNSRCEVIGSGSVGIHEKTQRLHYFCSIPISFAYPEIVLRVITAIPSLKKTIRLELNITSTGN